MLQMSPTFQEISLKLLEMYAIILEKPICFQVVLQECYSCLSFTLSPPFLDLKIANIKP